MHDVTAEGQEARVSRFVDETRVGGSVGAGENASLSPCSCPLGGACIGILEPQSRATRASLHKGCVGQVAFQHTHHARTRPSIPGRLARHSAACSFTVGDFSRSTACHSTSWFRRMEAGWRRSHAGSLKCRAKGPQREILALGVCRLGPVTSGRAPPQMERQRRSGEADARGG